VRSRGQESNVAVGVIVTPESLAENGGLVVDSETFRVVGPSGRRALPIHVLGDFSRSAWGATNTIAGAARQGEKLANVIAAEIGSQRNTEAYTPV